jgi:murein DD-endopeptidase MepM/ murein hydrolase activator NlpD
LEVALAKKKMMRWGLAVAALLCVFPGSTARAEEPAHLVRLVLPTDNDALFHGGGADFYQYIERNFHGIISTPWQGGQYGFVRDPIETGAGIIYTRFHEGMDIRPLRRDAQGDPTDEVCAIADGVVVHTNAVAGASNYGKYIVVEHEWDGCPYYSLYGHLHSIAVQIGRKVSQGDHLAVMGYTGQGLSQARAHLHLELNLLLSRQFESWYDTFFKKDPNRHGIYNGINLEGMDIARLYLALRKQPFLTIPEFISQEETFYKVIVRNSQYFELPKRYPWMVVGVPEGQFPSWEISFARGGLPLKMSGNQKSVSEPELSYVRKSSVDYRYLTRGEIGGRNGKAYLTENGKRLMRLLTYPE